MREFLVVANPNGDNFRHIKRAVQTVNGLQSYYRCCLIEDTDILRQDEVEVSAKELASKLRRSYPGRLPLIAITEEFYDSELIVEESYLPDVILVTAAEWDSGNPPAPRLFFTYAVASSLATLDAGLNSSRNKRMAHEPPVGCVFDWWDDEHMLRMGMISARLCLDCQSGLREEGVQAEALAALHRVWDFVRRAMIGQEATLPKKVFIAHGHGTDWLVLKEMLEELQVEVAEFNVVPPIGKLVVEHWMDMLDHSRFAFALLTPDDHFTKSSNATCLYPRLNVVHEIGLCHGRLGLESTAILREKSVEFFSNIDGINRIDFEGGKLHEKRAEIESLLRERGVI